MSVDGGWIGDPESTPCEMGGGPLVDYGIDPGVRAAHEASKPTRRGKPSLRVVALSLEAVALRIKPGMTRKESDDLRRWVRGIARESL